MIWTVVLVFFGLLGGVAFLGRRRLEGWTDRRQAREIIGTTVSIPDRALHGQVVVLEGEVAAGGGLVASYLGKGEAAMTTISPIGRARSLDGLPLVVSLSRRAPRLWLVTEDGRRVALDGPIEVLIGSREERPLRLSRPLRRELERLLTRSDLLTWELLGGKGVVCRNVISGDRVRIRGRLLHLPTADDGASYREAAADWVLTAVGGRQEDRRERLVAAVEGGARRWVRAWCALASYVAVGVMVGLSFLWTVGSVVISEEDNRRLRITQASEGRCVEVDHVPWLALAAATPTHRRDALERMREPRSCSPWRGEPLWVLGLWGSPEGGLVAVSNSILRHDGQGWRAELRGNRAPLGGVWGADDRLYAVGELGDMWRYDGRAWHHAPAPIETQLTDVWGVSPGEVLAVGSRGLVLRYDADGDAWTINADLGDVWLKGVWASGPDDVYVVGQSSIFHYDGARWVLVSPQTDQWLYDVWGSGPNDVFVVGSQGLILHYDGERWSEQASPFEGESLRAIHGSGPDNVWAAGDRGTIRRFDGRGWRDVDPEVDLNLVSIWAGGPDRVYAASQTTVFHFDGDSWERIRP